MQVLATPLVQKLRHAAALKDLSESLGQATLHSDHPRAIIRFELRNCEALDNSALAMLHSALPALRELDISGCENITDAAITMLARRRPSAVKTVSKVRRRMDGGLCTSGKMYSEKTSSGDANAAASSCRT